MLVLDPHPDGLPRPLAAEVDEEGGDDVLDARA